MTRPDERQQAGTPAVENDDGEQHEPRSVLLVVGPHVPNSEVRRHCLVALSAGRRVALVQLHPVSAPERYLLRALERWYGPSSVRLVESHADWAAASQAATVVVLSDRGLWRDDDRVADSAEVRALSRAAIERLYAETIDGSDEVTR